MFGRKGIVFFLLLLTGLVSLAQQKWSLGDCIDYALKNNLDIKSRRIASETNKEMLAQSKRERLPYIDAGTNYNVNFGKSVDPNTNDVTNNNFASNRYSLSGSVSLFDGFIRNNQIAYNRFIYRAGLAKEEAQKIEIAFAVMNAFHNSLYYKGLLEIVKEQKELSELNLEKVTKETEVGISAKTDILEIEARLAEEELLVIRTANNLNASLLDLKRAMNYPVGQELELQDLNDISYASSAVFENADSVYSMAVQHLPDVEAKQQELKAVERNLAIARGQLSPLVTLSGGYYTGYYETRTDQEGNPISFRDQFSNNASQSVGVTLSIPVFTRWRTRSEIKLNKLDLEAKKVELQNYKNQLYYEIESYCQELSATSAEYLQAKKQTESNELAFEVAQKKKGIRPKHIIYGVAGLVLIFLLMKIIKDSNITTLKVDREKITIEEVQMGDFDDFIRTNGTVEPISTIYLDAIEGGRVEEILIEEGAKVNKGDVILALENRTVYMDIMNSESNLAQKQNYLRQTRINFENALIDSRRLLLNSEFDIIKKKRNFEQQKALFQDDLVAKEDYLEAKENYEYAVRLLEINKQKMENDSMIRITEMNQLQKELIKMTQTLDLVRERLDNLNVKAPVDGQLGMLDAEIGQSIGRGQRIGQINVLTDFKIKALIDEHYIDRVRQGLSATFERQNSLFNLKVKKVYPEVRNSQFQIDLVFTDERLDNIRTGQTYYINLQLGQPQKSLLVGLGGFFNSTGGQWIYVLDPSGDFATKREIRIGRKNPKYYEVLEGLEPGEKVITSGYDLFGENDKLILK